MYTEAKYWYLRNHKLFWMLNNNQVKQLCIITRFKEAKKGEVIYFSESEEPKIYFLKKGNIKIAEVDENGNEQFKEIIQQGDLFGELSLDSSVRSNEFARALTNEVAICSFLMKDFEQLMEQYPNLAVSYTKFVGFKFKRLKNNYANLISKDARTRLIYFLKDWAEREGKAEGNRITLENYLTQNDIAQIICTSRQTATQLLNELETGGFLSYNRKEIIIENISALK